MSPFRLRRPAYIDVAVDALARGRDHTPSGTAPQASPRLGAPLNIREVAELIGVSTWTIRQTLMRRGLPHFRCNRRGRITFYREQVVRWIERQQQGGPQK